MNCTFTTWNIENQPVFLRADLNVPLINNKITGDFRLQSLRPTLDALLQKRGKIIIATHIGRPKQYTEKLSTRHLLPWFEQHKYPVTFAGSLEEAHDKLYSLIPGTALLLENLRFYPQEQQHSTSFAHTLRELANYYVNDAFGLVHRPDTSITLLPQLYSKSHKSIGFLIEKELHNLSYLKTGAPRPFVLILGGGKVQDKLPLIEAMLDRITTLLLCPALVFTFLKALGKPVGKSLVEDSLLGQAREILKKAAEKAVNIVFPVDYQIAYETLSGPLSYCSADNFPHNALGIALGPESIQLYAQEIERAKTIFFNGAMGLPYRPETYVSLYSLLQTIAQTTAYTVVGGGESVAAVYQYGLNPAINFCSTGGGSTLAYLSNKPLPGLKSML